MKTSLDIPEALLAELMKLTKTKTKKVAIITAITEYNQRRRIQNLTRHLGTLDGLMTQADLRKMRESK
jgi:Arc/MetJ family transcription regulator